MLSRGWGRQYKKFHRPLPAKLLSGEYTRAGRPNCRIRGSANGIYPVFLTFTYKLVIVRYIRDGEREEGDGDRRRGAACGEWGGN